MSAAARIEVRDSFRIKGRGEAIIYRELVGSLTLGAEVVSELHGDRWQVTSLGAFFDPPPPAGFERPPFLLLRPRGAHRKIQPGEIFRATETPEVSEAVGKPGFPHSELDHA